jgi:AmmeMemoRadiSam system protein B
MEKPRIRWVEAIPIMREGREMVLIRDAEGITENPLIVSKDVVFLLSLMDGTRSLRDIQVDYMRAYGELIYIERIQELVDTMDSNFLLFNDNFKGHYTRLKEEYEGAPLREPFLSGKSYSENSYELAMFLDEMLKTTGDYDIHREVTGILAPHIDYARGKEVYREAYRYLRHVEKPLLVILGTSHRPIEKIWSISLKDFSTPLGVIPNSKELRGLIRDNQILKEYIAEWPHRSEHSIELQLPIIQFVVAERSIEILPILTGSMQEYIEGSKGINDETLLEIIGNFKETLNIYGKPYVIISGADLAHIGVQFGDTYQLDPYTLNQSKQRDETILNCIRNVDAKGFFEAIKDEGDRRRICGLTPIYFQLSFLEGSSCDKISYKQWTDGSSSVSFAGGVFYKT